MDFHKWRFLPTISSSVVIKLTKGISGDHGKGGEGRDERNKKGMEVGPMSGKVDTMDD